MPQLLYPDWRTMVVYGPGGPQPQVLVENDRFKVILAGLESGQRIPAHPEAEAMYHFLEGAGWMLVGDERFAVGPGATVLAPAGAKRGIEAESRLAFLAARVAEPGLDE